LRRQYFNGGILENLIRHCSGVTVSVSPPNIHFETTLTSVKPKAGAGKTFLWYGVFFSNFRYCLAKDGGLHSSVMIDHLLAKAPTANFGVAYIYFNYNEQDQQRPVDILASVVKQLVIQSPQLSNELQVLYDDLKPKGKRPSSEDLYELLLATSKTFTRTFIVCDALDECNQTKQRERLLPLLHRMKESGFWIFLTSRPYPEDIQEYFSDSAKINLSAHKDDIQAHIRARIDGNIRARCIIRDKGLEDQVVPELTDCAKGM
jgi:hypothetical protein